MCVVCPRVKFEIGRGAVVRLGRWSWVGHGSKIRAHEGEVSIGAKTVMGQECTISAFQHVAIGRECIIADRVMLIDFDHGVVETERPVREQGIYKRDVRVGHNVWIGYGACVLHVSPESAIGGPLALVRDGDIIELDVHARRIHLRVSDAELARRPADWKPPPPRFGRGHGELFRGPVTQAHEGCDFRLLHHGAPMPEPDIY